MGDDGDPRELFGRLGAMLGGHFELSSGLHSDRYVQTARLLERPEQAMAVARRIASWYDGVDVVAAPAVGAIVLGWAVALAAGARAIFAERGDAGMRFRRGFGLASGERTLVVDNVVTTGGSAREVVDLATSAGATVLGVAALVDRSTEPMPYRLRAALRVEAVAWPPDDCPLCRAGEPIDSPGSRRLGGAG